jgi:5'-AMP-activated protein kinase beta subunit, interaction domain/Glycogen recognition site of AMP-activated protein kinase
MALLGPRFHSSAAVEDARTDSHTRKDGEGFATTINLPPGTHHLMFLVDESMRTTTEMPTAVDFSNFLVNYIEVATEDLQKGRRESKAVDEKRDSIHQIHPPMLPTKDDYDSDNESRPGEDVDPQAEEIQAEDFRRIQPQPLIDMDLSEDDGRYHQAARIISGCPNPPSLPMFLNRSLLNGYTPVKDDSSVLTLPNHTVLNHLMTSSVKNGVLATSVTTRYKKKVRGPLSDKDRADTGKYVTTISFKPVPKAQAA